MNVNWAYGGDRFAIYTNIKSLLCTPEYNMFYANYTSVLKKLAVGGEELAKETEKRSGRHPMNKDSGS